VFRGVAVALVTLFDDDLAVDASATAALATTLVDRGVAAVVVTGSTGEAAALSAEERVAVTAAVHEAVGARVPVIAGTGAPWWRPAAEQTAAARDAGAAAALVLSPLGAADPRRYYDAVARAVPDLPLLAYHFPATSPPGIPVGALADLPVVGVKDSSGDVERLLAELDAWDRPVYPGSAALVSTAAALGCPGVILALANAEPERCVAAFGGDGDGDAQRALNAAHVAAKASFPHGIKALTSARFGTSTSARMG
jgi:4-hydroxy-tetrahydrodipicolinate synthase